MGEAARVGTDTSRVGTMVVECHDTAAVLARISSLGWKLGVEVVSLSTWVSVTSPGVTGMSIAYRCPATISDAMLIKRLNKIIGIVRIKTDHGRFVPVTPQVGLHVTATFQRVDPVALVAYRHGATVCSQANNVLSVQLTTTRSIADTFVSDLAQVAERPLRGEISLQEIHLA
ncbi:hypothetical protein [Rhodococcus qingshengii]|uniref:hypothetical protein n=1 Tax=Rhodococcus qingshengii TaxID=334542 RepID=UPI002AFF2727|nr:hypothetical protein [Rhodococcus qingshengii]MEA1798355.1 hypothetical protein [Rhodococcus qingshengii]